MLSSQCFAGICPGGGDSRVTDVPVEDIAKMGRGQLVVASGSLCTAA